MSLMGVDIGTTGTKSVVFDESGTILASHYQDYPLHMPAPDRCELDPDQVWEAIVRVVRMSSTEAGKTDPVQAIGISTLGDSVTLLDEGGKTLSFTVIGAADRRAVPQTEWIEQQFSRGEIFERTGAPLHAYCTIPKVMWFRDNRPDLFDAADKFTGWQEIMHLRLGLEPAMDFSLASRTMLVDIHERSWAEALLQRCGLSPERFFPLAESSHVVGRLDRNHARALDLEPGVAVAAGGFDQCCCALGAGVVTAGKAANSVGTLESIIAVADRYRLEYPLLEGNYGCGIHITGGTYFSLGYVTTSGAVLRWYRDRLGMGEVAEAEKRGEDPYELIIRSSTEGPSPVYALPYFAGSGTPWLDIHQKGTLFGLSLDTERSDIVKGILDGICYEVRLNVETMASAGVNIASLRSIGGGTRSDRWMQLKADITGIPVEVTEVTEAGCLGAAFLAGLGTGTYTAPADIEHIAKVRTVFEPRQEQVRRYEGHYRRYLELRERVRGLKV